MKKIYILLITLLICISVQGCTQPVPESVKIQLPEIPRSLYAVTEITPESMAELERQVSQLDINHLFHPDRIAELEKQGISVAVENMTVNDCNTMTFDVVLTKTDGKSLTLPVAGMLMYQYLPMNDCPIADLQVVWGNISICDELIVLANVDTLSFWHSDTLEQTFRQPDMSFAQQAEYFFILDAIKNKDNYILPYFSGASSGFVILAISGNVVDTPLMVTSENNGEFGSRRLMESRSFNTTARAANRIHCFYGDEAEKQIFMAFDRDDDYYGMDYVMYNSESGQLFSSSFMASYSTQDCRYDLYAMCIGNGGYHIGKETTFLAVKKADGKSADRVVFSSAVNPAEFGKDTTTGWNTHTHISLSEDMNILGIGCDKTRKVINIDFSQGTAETLSTSTMPRMQGVDNSPNAMHMLYLTATQHGASLMVRNMSGNFEMDYISDVTGRWGVDWQAGFYTHQYIYLLTESQFMLFSWNGTNYWNKTVHITGEFTVNSETADRLCSVYSV